MRKGLIITLVYIGVVLSIILPWLSRPGYLFLTDFVWGPHMDIHWQSPQWLLQLLIAAVGYVLPVDLVQKLFVGFVVLVLLLAGKKIVSQFTGNIWLQVVLSLFFLFNPFVYDRMLFGQMGIVLAFGFLAWSVGYLLEWWQTRTWRSWILSSVLAGLSLQFSPHNVFLWGAFLLLFVVVPWRSLGWKTLGKIVSAAVIVMALNFNWLLALATQQSPTRSFIAQGITRQDLVAFQTSGRTGAEAARNVLLMSGFWGKDQYRYFDLTRLPNVWGRSFIVLAPLIIYGAYSLIKDARSRKLGLGLLVILLVSLGLAVGIRLPVTREITYWLFDHLPFYKGLRETQKWAACIVIIYGIFLAVGFKHLLQVQWFKQSPSLLSWALAVVIIAQAPLLLWGFRGQARPVQYPFDWYLADQLIVHNSHCQQKILFLPWHLYMRFGFTGSVVANPAQEYFTCPVLRGTNMEFGGIYDNSAEPSSAQITQWIAADGHTNLLADEQLNIGYVVLAKELDWSSYEWLDESPQLNQVLDTPVIRIYQVIK